MSVNLFEPEIIVTCMKKRFTGVSGTINALLPVQAGQFSIAYVGVELPGSLTAVHEHPESYRRLSFFRAAMMSARRLADGRPRIWHVRRNHEMLLAIVLRDFFRLPIKILFTSAAIRRHSALPRWLISRMDAVIATTQAAAKLLENTTAIQGHGVDTIRFSPAVSRANTWTESSLPGRYGIGVFGRVRAEKGVHLFVAAMIELLPSFPEWTAVIGGLCQHEDQAFEDELKLQVEKAGLTSRVIWLGEIAAAKMPEWYQRMSITVACPLYEGFGLTPLEAMACGSAIVASRTGAFEEMVDPGVSGELVPVGDIPSLVDSIRRLMSNPDQVEKMGLQGRTRVLQKFSIESEASGIAEVYQKLWNS